MAYFIYILESELNGDFYKGITENVERPLIEHNEGKSQYTSSLRPWRLVFFKEMPDKRSALIEEKRIKKLNRISLLKFINS